MILLVWDSFGEEPLRFYEFEGGSVVADLAKSCHECFINAAGNSVSTEEDLSNLWKFVSTDDRLNDGIRIGQGRQFGPYIAIYVSGFIP
jgi:hypothetical protein